LLLAVSAFIEYLISSVTKLNFGSKTPRVWKRHRLPVIRYAKVFESTRSQSLSDMFNFSVDSDLPPLPAYTLKPLPPLVSFIPDKYLCLILLVVVYWVASLFFHWIDVNDFFPQYRLHTPEELLKRNHVSRWEVFRDVIIQQAIETLFGVALGYFEPDPVYGKEDYDVAVWAQRIRIVQRPIPTLLALLGLDASGFSSKLRVSYPVIAGVLQGGNYSWLTQVAEISGHTTTVPAFAAWELAVAKAIYWVVVPALQFALAIIVLDTWQYFWHRAMHMNKWLYGDDKPHVPDLVHI
jgi:sphinganine C4-monooxygenase